MLHGNRRGRILLGAGVAITSLVLAACGSGGDGDSSSGGTPTLVMYGSAGAIEDAMVKDLLPTFEKEHNVKVTYVGMTASQALLKSQANRGNPEASLVIANDLAAAVGTQQGIWSELDENKISELKNIPDGLLDDGHAAATGYWAVGIAYNSQVYQDQGIQPPTDWADLFDPAVSGHVVQYDIGWGYTAPFLYAWNTELGSSYDDWSPVLGQIEKGKGNFQSIAAQASDFDQAFQQGVGWVGMQASMRGGIAKAGGLPVEMVYPSSGVPKLVTTAMIPEGAPEPELAAELLNYILTPEVQAVYAGTQYYVPANPDTQVPADVAAVLPDLDSLKAVPIDWLKLQEALPGLTQEWNQKVLSQ